MRYFGFSCDEIVLKFSDLICYNFFWVKNVENLKEGLFYEIFL